MKFEDRWYQEEAVEAGFNDIHAGLNPIIVAPTGSGKSAIICKIIDKIISKDPAWDIIVLSHVDDILSQNYERLVAYFTEYFVGLYSAGLKSREVKKITVCGIQSVYNKPELFQQNRKYVVIIDECHMINMNDEGMYRAFLKTIGAQYLGLTATPFRTGQGYLYKNYPGFTPIFNKLSYDISSYENYNRLVDEEYLVKLVPPPVNYQMDASDIKEVGGDYKVNELGEKFDRDEITEIIVKDIIKYARKKYKKWLIFAIDKAHCFNIVCCLQKHGIPVCMIYSGMEGSKKEVIKQFREGKFKALVNVNMATTGLDIPEIDLVALLRPTKSPIYHVQTQGRGARPAPWIDKDHCLVLDYAGNISRLGTIDDVKGFEPGDKKKAGEGKMSKSCPNCKSENSLRARFCCACGEEFVLSHKLEAEAFTAGEVGGKTYDADGKEKLEKWCKVKNVRYSIHNKVGSPSSLRVQYQVGMNQYSEWVLIEHHGFHGAKARKWVKNRWDPAYQIPAPTKLDDLYKNSRLLKAPEMILVNLEGKYPEIKDYKFADTTVSLNLKTESKIISASKDVMREKMLSAFNDDSPDFEDDVPF